MILSIRETDATPPAAYLHETESEIDALLDDCALSRELFRRDINSLFWHEPTDEGIRRAAHPLMLEDKALAIIAIFNGDERLFARIIPRENSARGRIYLAESLKNCVRFTFVCTDPKQ